MNIAVKLSLLTFVLFLNGVAFSQIETSNKAKVENTKNSVSSKQQGGWNPSLGIFGFEDRLPTSYKGVSAKAIMQYIWKEFPEKKGEYEKQEEYDQKRASVEEKLAGKLYAFEISSRSSIGYDHYDPDKEAFIPKNYVSVKDKFSTDFESTDLGKYYASNAYGKTVQVTKSYSTSFGIYFDEQYLSRSTLFSKKNLSFYLTRSLEIPIDKAKKINSQDLKILVVAEITSAAIINDPFCFKPKIDSPIEGCYSQKNIRVKPHEFIIYNFKTGDILFRQGV